MNMNIKPVVKVDAKRKQVEVRTSKARLSFPNLFEPKPFMRDGEPQGEPKYNVQLLLPKKSDIAWLRKAIDQAAKMTFGEKLPKNFNHPLKDGNEIFEEKQADGKDGYEAYKNMWVISASTGEKYPPKVVGKTRQELNQSDIYGGCWAIVAGTLKGYTAGVNKGVTLYLSGVQKTDDDESFGGGKSADQLFEEFEEESENESNYSSDDESEESFENFES